MFNADTQRPAHGLWEENEVTTWFLQELCWHAFSKEFGGDNNAGNLPHCCQCVLKLKKSEAFILEKPSYFIHISLAQLNSLVQAVWHAYFWNSVEVNTDLSYKVAGIIDKKCALSDWSGGVAARAVFFCPPLLWCLVGGTENCMCYSLKILIPFLGIMIEDED